MENQDNDMLTVRSSFFLPSAEDPEPVVVRCRHIIENEFMTPETTNKLAEILITKYMRLTEDDLEEWDSNPEEWALEEEADSWKYQLRVSCLRLPVEYGLGSHMHFPSELTLAFHSLE